MRAFPTPRRTIPGVLPDIRRFAAFLLLVAFLPHLASEFGAPSCHAGSHSHAETHGHTGDPATEASASGASGSLAALGASDPDAHGDHAPHDVPLTATAGATEAPAEDPNPCPLGPSTAVCGGVAPVPPVASRIAALPLPGAILTPPLSPALTGTLLAQDLFKPPRG